MSTTDTEQLRNGLVAQAEAAYSAYPQFSGRWDAWLLGRLTRRVWLFGRSYGEKGEYVLVDPMLRLRDPIPDRQTAWRGIYSNINKVEAHVPADAVEEMST